MDALFGAIGLTAMIVAIVVMIIGGAPALRLPSRKHAALLLGGGFVLFVIGVAMTPPENNEDPASATAESDERGADEPTPPDPVEESPQPEEQTTEDPVAIPTGTASPEPPPHEIVVDRCEKVGFEVIASGTIKNLDTEAHVFAVKVEFFDEGGAKIEEGTDFLRPIEPGQTARWQQDNYTESEFTLGDCTAKLF